YGNAAGNCALEIECNAVLLGECGEARPVMGKQGLVGGDHVLPRGERRLDRVPCDALLSADQLDEDVDPGLLGESNGIVDETQPRNVPIPLFLSVPSPGGGGLNPRPPAPAQAARASL